MYTEEFFNRLINDEKGKEILSKFRSSEWQKLDYKSRKQLLNSLEDVVSTILNEKPVALNFDNYEQARGAYFDEKNYILMNPNHVKSNSQYDVLNTYFHERRHKLQHDAINGKINENLITSLNQNDIKNWKRNFIYDALLNIYNYISPQNGQKYFYQDVEMDAFFWGDRITVKIGKELEKIYGKDPGFSSYLLQELNESSLIALPQDEKEKNLDEIKEFWDKNEKMIEECKQRSNEQKQYLKSIQDIDKGQFYLFFNEYVWFNLDVNERAIVLKELDRRERLESAREPISIKVTKKGLLSIDGEKIDKDNSVINVLNTFFTFANENEVHGIIDEKVSKYGRRIRNELRVNLMRDKEGKLINFYDSKEHPFLYCIQPFGIFENSYIHKRLSEIYPYGVTNLSDNDKKYTTNSFWRLIIDGYDNNLIKKMTEEFYGKSFKEVYYENLQKMLDKAVKALDEIKTENKR